jgi:hypothetical protein
LSITSTAELAEITDLTLEEIEVLTVGELNEIFISANGPEANGILFDLTTAERRSTGLSDEELAALTVTELFDLGPFTD